MAIKCPNLTKEAFIDLYSLVNPFAIETINFIICFIMLVDNPGSVFLC